MYGCLRMCAWCEIRQLCLRLGCGTWHDTRFSCPLSGRQLTTSSLAAYAVHGRSATTLLSGPTDAEGRPTGVRPKYELLNKINNGDDDAATALAVETKSFVDTLQILKHRTVASSLSRAAVLCGLLEIGLSASVTGWCDLVSVGPCLRCGSV